MGNFYEIMEVAARQFNDLENEISNLKRQSYDKDLLIEQLKLEISNLKQAKDSVKIPDDGSSCSKASPEVRIRPTVLEKKILRELFQVI